MAYMCNEHMMLDHSALGILGKILFNIALVGSGSIMLTRVSDIYFRKCINKESNGSNLKVITSKRVKLQFQQTTVTDTNKPPSI